MSKLQKIIRRPFKIKNILEGKQGQINYYTTIDCVNTASDSSTSLPEALVFFLPGFAENCANYGYFFDKFSERLGLTTIAVDLHNNKKDDHIFI